jgi:hypothetical protein
MIPAAQQHQVAIVSRPLRRLALTWLSAAALSCSAAEQPAELPLSSAGASTEAPTPGNGGASGSPSAGTAGASAGSPSSAGNGGAAALNPLGRARCVAPPGVSAAPQSIQEAVQLLNALPKPTTVACFIESLARPLITYATSSPISAQPALSFVSPRVFIKVGPLWISIVIDGSSSYLIEFGELVDENEWRSIKGELELPLYDVIAASAPYDQIQFNDGTVCGLCHNGEERAENIPFENAFSSIAFRPRPDSRVSVDSLRSQEQACDWQLEPHRCEMLSAVFGGGVVEETPFPDTMDTFF